MKEEDHSEYTQTELKRLNLRNKGVRTSGGKVHKGCVKDAFSKLSIGSIPSNYQSIVYKQNQKKGFGTQSKRFYNQNQSSQILRGDNDLDVQASQPQKKVKESHSTKGYGPLIAKQKRQWRKYPHSPSPCRYFDLNSSSAADTKKRRNCFTRQKQQDKIREIAMNKENQINPGPGYYQLQHKNQHSLLGWKSSFVTKDNRQGYIEKKDVPGPGEYPPQQNKDLKQPPKRQLPQGQLYSKLLKDKQHLQKHFLAKPKHPQQPGPGHYEVIEESNFKPLYQRIKISHNFIQNNRDRFDEPINPLSNGKTSPTATTYDVPSSFDKIEKKLIDTCAFMSQSKRVVFEGGSTCPQKFYDTVKQANKNFHFNISGRWV